MFNIFCIPKEPSQEGSTPFICDENLTERVSKRLTKQYNNTWSSHRKYVKTSTFPLDCIVGYVYSDKQELNYEQAIKLLVKQF
jgi:hypothetical protein